VEGTRLRVQPLKQIDFKEIRRVIATHGDRSNSGGKFPGVGAGRRLAGAANPRSLSLVNGRRQLPLVT
jgi:hypothetical protein